MNRKLKLWELNRVSNEEFKAQNKFPIIVVLDNIRSLNNVGTFFRTSDAFNVQEIILCGITGKPPHREINKTAIGATESVAWSYAEDVMDVVDSLKQDGVKICAIEQTEVTTFLNKMEVNEKETYALFFGNEVDGVQQSVIEKETYALFFGNEVDGVQQSVIDASDYIIEIPQFGTKHSLNVSVCAGVTLWEFVRDRN